MDPPHAEIPRHEGSFRSEGMLSADDAAQHHAPQPPGTSQQHESPQPSKDIHPEDLPSGQQRSLDPWAAVEGEMMKEDEATMKGHMEDVDYLLVFAGLFSAVLTAFAVESYQQLQPDNQEISSKLLQRISIQLTPCYNNSTLPVPALPSVDFTADTIARWINILWFLSLIFSLAAALFGILVKQWIREYMRWNSALANPRDNVLVRQIRYEAWHDWNIPATIAAVPALLEIALVLFVSGLVFLLWTLDPVVSIVITTAAAVFVAIVATFTFLPAFFRRCPYKSPTAWALVILRDFFMRYIPHKFRSLQRSLGDWVYYKWRWNRTEHFGKWLEQSSGLCADHPRIGSWTAFSHDWRSRDLDNLWSSLWAGTQRGDAIPLVEELNPERREPLTGFEASDYPDLPAMVHDAQRTITELSPLVRALAWVSQASQDAPTQTHVLSCVESLETRFTLPHNLSTNGHFISNVFDEDGVRDVSYWYLALDVQREQGRAIGQDPRAHERKDVVSLRDNIMPFDAALDQVFYPFSGPKGYIPLRAYWMPLFRTSPDALILLHLLTFSVKTLVTALLDPRPSSPLRGRNVQRLRQYLAVLYHYGYRSGLHSSADHGDHLYDTFEMMVHQDANIRDSFYSFSEWRPVMLETAYIIGSPKLKKLMNYLRIEVEDSSVWLPLPWEVWEVVNALSSRPSGIAHSQETPSHDTVQDIDVALNRALDRLPHSSLSLPAPESLVADAIPAGEGMDVDMSTERASSEPPPAKTSGISDIHTDVEWADVPASPETNVELVGLSRIFESPSFSEYSSTHDYSPQSSTPSRTPPSEPEPVATTSQTKENTEPRHSPNSFTMLHAHWQSLQISQEDREIFGPPPPKPIPLALRAHLPPIQPRSFNLHSGTTYPTRPPPPGGPRRPLPVPPW